MRTTQLYRYQLPLYSGQILRTKHPDNRQGLLVCLQQDKQQGWGEIAPLPGFSTETLAQASEAVRQWLTLWRTGVSVPLPALPSVAFGLSCALAELAHTLPVTASVVRVPLFSLVANYHHDLAAVVLAKCKIARTKPEQEARQISQLLHQYPQIRLRLDANRGWTPQQARQFAAGLSTEQAKRIVFIEEPCHSVAQSCAFGRDTGLPLAWDESLREAGNDLLSLPGTVALVIKPTLTGSLAQVRELTSQAQARGIMVIISSAIESSFGLTQLARLAHWLTPDTPPGLDTLSLLGMQLVRRWPGSQLPCLTVQQLERLC